MDYKCKLRIIFAEREIQHGDFAKVIGISNGALSSIVNNRSFPSFKIAYKISEELNMDIREIWTKKNKE